MQKIYFNLTTQLEFPGPPVGIVRHDYEVALRLSGMHNVHFFRYVPERSEFQELRNEPVRAALASGYGSIRGANIETHTLQCFDQESSVLSIGLDWDYVDAQRLVSAIEESNCQFIMSFNDCIAIRTPDIAGQPLPNQKLLAYFSQVLPKANKIHLISRVAAGDLEWLESHHDLKLKADKILNHLGQCFSRVGSPSRNMRAIYVSSLEARKNHLFILDVYEAAHNDGVDLLPIMFIGRDAGVGAQIRARLESPALKNKISIRSDVFDSELEELLANSLCTLFPSRSEGWGQGVAESLRMGVPVLASDIPALRECSQACAVLLPVNDRAAWTDALLKMRDDPQYRIYAENLAAQFQPRSWDDHFNQLMESIE